MLDVTDYVIDENRDDIVYDYYITGSKEVVKRKV